MDALVRRLARVMTENVVEERRYVRIEVGMGNEGDRRREVLGAIYQALRRSPEMFLELNAPRADLFGTFVLPFEVARGWQPRVSRELISHLLVREPASALNGIPRMPEGFDLLGGINVYANNDPPDQNDRRRVLCALALCFENGGMGGSEGEKEVRGIRGSGKRREINEIK